MKEIFCVFKNRKCLLHMVISGIIFMALAAPFKILFTLIPGVTEIRPANMLPVVFGLVWGPAGAWGTAIANALSDVLVSKSPAVVWVPGFFINFFYSYLPYKLWYSLKSGSGKVSQPRFEHVSQIIKYVYICLLDSLVVTVFLGLLFEALGFQSYASSVLLLFFNNFDFSIVLGVPVILLLTSSKKMEIWIPMDISREEDRTPEEAKKKRKLPFFLNGFDMMIYLVSAAGILYFLAGLGGAAALSAQADCIMMGIIAAALCLYPLKPMDYLRSRKEEEKYSGISIRGKVIIGFLILSVTFILIVGVTAYTSYGTAGSTRKEAWQYIYSVVGIALNILLILSLIFLQYTEKNITNPLESLSSMVREFAVRDHENAEDNRRFLANCEKVHTGDEIEELSESFFQMMGDITDYMENLERMTKEKERIGAELAVATQIQADMLPRIFPPFPEKKEFDIYASMNPAKEVGGDFYDFFLVDERHLALVIADVSGKGVPAALFMVIAKTLIKNHAQLGAAPEIVFNVVNNQLCEGNEAGLFVTAWLGILDIMSGELTFVNAGHNPPLLRCGQGGYEYLKAPAGFVLAGIEDMDYRQNQIQLSRGDSLFLYTDGVTEAENVDNELFGDERLRDTINGMAAQSAEDIIGGIREAVAGFVGEAEQFDDITMVSLVYNGREI